MITKFMFFSENNIFLLKTIKKAKDEAKRNNSTL
jgi:hypothetical protein